MDREVESRRSVIRRASIFWAAWLVISATVGAERAWSDTTEQTRPANLVANEAVDASGGKAASAGVSSRSGAATLQIPIEVPQGTGGLQPSLSLAYSSNNPDGIFGIGWGRPDEE